MRYFTLLCAFSIALLAQATGQQPVIGGAGYSFPVPLSVAPGQLITLFVQGVNTQLASPVRAESTPWPTTLAGVSVTYHQGSDQLAAMLEVRPISTCLGSLPPSGAACGTILAVTAQLPFQMLTLCPLCGRPDIPATLSATVNGVVSQSISVQPLSDQVHFVTACDVMMPSSQTRIGSSPPPCPPMVTHADGKLVSAGNPAKSGEELVAYAVGLGQTDPSLTLGQPAASAAPTATTFAIDFNYHANAGPSGPIVGRWFATTGPLFTGATPGFTGLYQINFIVPESPAGLPGCIDAATLPPVSSAVQSNLTVSVGSAFSFDGAGICVQPET